MLGADPQCVGRLTRHGAGDRAGEAGVLRRLVDLLRDLGHGGDAVMGGALAGVLPSLAAALTWERPAIDGVGRRIVDPPPSVAGHDLGVAAGGLELEAQVALGRPQAARGALEQRVAALDARVVDQLVGERDARSDALHRGRGQSVVDRLGQRLGRRLGGARADRDGDGRAAGGDEHGGDAQREQTRGGKAAKEVHVTGR